MKSKDKALVEKWEKILESQGLGLIENTSLTPQSKLSYFSTLGYFEIGRSALEVGLFNSETDKTIWELHVEGFSNVIIANSIFKSASVVCRRIIKMRVSFNLPRLLNNVQNHIYKDEEITAYWQQGFSQKEIGQMIGYSIDRIKKRACALNLRRNKVRIK